MLLGTELGTLTDTDGNFRLSGLPAGSYTFSVSMVGYTPEVRKKVGILQNSTVRQNIQLTPTAIQMPALVVTASKRPKNLVDVTTSVSLLDGDILRLQNSVSLDESLDYAPGINMVSGQVNVRGSSGYSRGTGSRVLLLIDGFPALSADNGEIKWDAIPMDQIERVEIIKGAGSALYGTGALGGIINIITQNPTSEPETRFSLLAGLYSDPLFPEWAWSSGRRYLQGIDISHSRTEGKLGMVLGVGQKWTNGFRENGWHRRYKGFGKVQYKFTPTTSLTATSNFALDDHGVFIQWEDRNEPLEVPDRNQGDKTISRKLNLNLAFYRLLSSRTGYRIKTFVYHTDFDNDVENDSAPDSSTSGSTAYKFGQEAQIDLETGSSVFLTLGAEWIADRVSASDDLFGQHTGYNLASYIQAELDLAPDLNLSLGARYDRHKTDSTSAVHRLSPKIGLAFKPTAHTAFRSTLGWGFRGPSIAELYINAEFSGVPIRSNPDLQPERSLSWEIGLNRQHPVWFHFDLAAFWTRYQDLIEARPEPSGEIRFHNVSKGRIAGIETTLRASFGRISAEGSYTFMDATENLPAGNQPLPYRPRHIASAGAQYTLGLLALEGRFTYRSPIRRGVSVLFSEGTRDLIAVYLVDLSASYDLGSVTATFKIHNALEYNYAEVERNLGPPRRFTLGLSGAF